MDSFYQRAYAMISSKEAREAFNLAAESDALKEKYGKNSAGMYDSGMTYLAFGTREPGEVVYYPRSRKAWLGPLLVRIEPVEDYWEGEV